MIMFARELRVDSKDKPGNCGRCQNTREGNGNRYGRVQKAKAILGGSHTKSLSTTSRESNSLTRNEQLITDYVAAVNSHSTPTALLNFYASKKVRINFDDMPRMTALSVQIEVQSVYQSFTDLRLDYDSIQETSPGMVFLDNLRMSGTHNGDPYKFANFCDQSIWKACGVANFPAIKASGKHARLDPETTHFTITDGKIVREIVTAMGISTGPLDMYELVGAISTPASD